MAIVTLTTDQRVNLEGNARFQALVRAAIYNQANYWRNIDGTNIADAGDAARWAKSRYLSVGIIQNPNGIDFTSWLKQYIIILKDIAVVDDEEEYTEDGVIDYMLENSKFDELSDLVFNLRIQKVEF